MSKVTLTAMALALLAQGAETALAQEVDRIGTTAAATNQVEGRRSGTQRSLKIGDGVFREEEIRTGRASKAQLLLRDETVFSIGPNSVMVLDKFVYDPDKKAGEMAIKAVTGTFRFVSGAAPKENYRINTPAGSIGVRGTSLTFSIVGNTLTLKLDSGSAELCSGSSCTKLTQPGTYVVSSGGNTTPPQTTSESSCGGTTCSKTYSEAQPLVQSYVSDVIGTQATAPARPPLESPNDSPRGGNGFFGPRP